MISMLAPLVFFGAIAGASPLLPTTVTITATATVFQCGSPSAITFSRPALNPVPVASSVGAAVFSAVGSAASSAVTPLVSPLSSIANVVAAQPSASVSASATISGGATFDINSVLAPISQATSISVIVQQLASDINDISNKALSTEKALKTNANAIASNSGNAAAIHRAMSSFTTSLPSLVDELTETLTETAHNGANLAPLYTAIENAIPRLSALYKVVKPNCGTSADSQAVQRSWGYIKTAMQDLLDDSTVV
ncbi:hypothetical protein MKEN_00857000 [Mycena kentingensis (nom. inval.)]|nr:hypothetical protein MKEN_00857000 [Mycena kentingensis (nom. inval.)]